MEHIAILSHRSVLDRIITGKKTIESRFSRLKSLPFGQVAAGDIIYFKLSGGPVLCRAVVSKIVEYDNLNSAQIMQLAKQYEKELALSEDFVLRKLESKYASLIFLEQVEECEPWNYKQDGRSGWIVLEMGRTVNLAPNLAPADPAQVQDFRALGLK